MKTATITLVRHGKVSGAPALYGHTDVAVEEGLQVDILNKLLASEVSFEQIVSSPLKRCSELARLLGEKTNKKVSLNTGLMEMNFGDLDGVPFDDISSNSSEWHQMERFWQAPAQVALSNGESLKEFAERVIRAWSHFCSEVCEDTLIITHGGVIRVIIAHLLGADWQDARWYTTLNISNASTTQITISLFEGEPFYSIKAIGCPLLTKGSH